MKLTPQVLLKAPLYRSPIGESLLSLRSLDAPLIENFGVIGDAYEAIDLTDNDIKILGNFPPMAKVASLYIARNKIKLVSSAFAECMPNLQRLSLVNNNLSRLSDIDPLHDCLNLHSLYLVGNRITSHKYYRLWVIWRIPSLKVLDFQKVKDKERAEARELFGTLEEPTKLAKDIMSTNSMDAAMEMEDDVDEEDKADTKVERQITDAIKMLTKEEKEKLENELANATSLDEIERLETILQNGYL